MRDGEEAEGQGPGAASVDVWMAVVRELAAQEKPASLLNAVVELGVALHRVEVAKAAMQARVRRMMGDPEESERPIAEMRKWPEYDAQEEASLALKCARRAVEQQAREWVTGAVTKRALVVQGPEAAAHEALLGAAEKPATSPDAVRAALVEMAPGDHHVIAGVAVRRKTLGLWVVEGDEEAVDQERAVVRVILAAQVRAIDAGAKAAPLADETPREGLTSRPAPEVVREQLLALPVEPRPSGSPPSEVFGVSVRRVFEDRWGFALGPDRDLEGAVAVVLAAVEPAKGGAS